MCTVARSRASAYKSVLIVVASASHPLALVRHSVGTQQTACDGHRQALVGSARVHTSARLWVPGPLPCLPGCRRWNVSRMPVGRQLELAMRTELCRPHSGWGVRTGAPPAWQAAAATKHAWRGILRPKNRSGTRGNGMHGAGGCQSTWELTWTLGSTVRGPSATGPLGQGSKQGGLLMSHPDRPVGTFSQ